MNNQSDLNLPKLAYSLDSILKLNEFIDEYKGDSFALIRQLIIDGINTVITQHNSIYDLMNIVNIKPLFLSLTATQKNELINLYQWSIKTIKSKETRLTNVKEHNYITLDTFDNAFDFQSVIESEQLIASNAMMGTGKTSFLAVPFINKAREMGYTPIVVAHRIALMSELSTNTNTVNYQSLGLDENNDHNAAIKKGLAFCFNSIMRPDIQSLINSVDGKYVLVIDEYNQTLSSLGDSTFKNPETALKAMTRLIRGAKSVIIADADMTDYSLNITEKIRNRQSECYFVKKDNSHLNVNITLQHGKGYDQVDLFFGQIAEHLNSGKKCVFYSNRVKICQALNQYLNNHHQQVKTLLVCQHTENDKYAKAFKANAEQEAKNYDCIMISPTITSGVSVVDDNFKTSFSVFDASTLSHLEAIQQMHRFRNVTTHNMILMTKAISNESLDYSPEQISAELNYSVDELNAKSGINRLIRQIKKDKTLSRQSFPQFITSRLKDLGYNVHIHDEVISNLAYDVEEVIKTLTIIERNNILASMKPTFREYNAIKQKLEVNDTEHYQVLNYEISRALNLPPRTRLTDDFLEIYSDGRGLSAVRRNAILFDAIDADFMEQNEIKNNIPLSRRRFPNHVKNLSKQYASEIFGRDISIADLMNLSNPLTFKNSDLNPFARLVEKTAPQGALIKVLSSKQVKRNFRIPDKSKDLVYESVPVLDGGRSYVAKQFLLKMGMKFISVDRNRIKDLVTGEAKDEHIYAPDFKHLMIMYELLGYQKDKTDEIKRLHDEKIKALKAKSTSGYITKTIDDLNSDELLTLDTLVNAIISEYHAVEKGAFLRSCDKCFTPTNGYVCECCDNHELSSFIDIDKVNIDNIRYGIFEALKHKIVNMHSEDKENIQ